MVKKQYLKSKPVCKVTFTLNGEQVGTDKDVRVLGDFNGWSWEQADAMKYDKKKGAYSTTVELPAEARRYQFRYLVDRREWMSDSGADEQERNEYGSENSIIIIEPAASGKSAPATKAASAKEKEPAKGGTKKPAKKATAKAPAKGRSTVASDKGDDLTKIEGIGPKIAKLLQDKQINSYQALADAKTATLKQVLEDAGPRFRMHDPGTWQQQAKLAAAGNWDKLKSLQKDLKGGKAKKK